MNNRVTVLGIVWGLSLAVPCAFAGNLEGRISDPQGRVIAGATIRISSETRSELVLTSNDEGQYQTPLLDPGVYTMRVEAAGLMPVTSEITVTDASRQQQDVQILQAASQHDSIVITSTAIEPGVDLRNSEVFNRTLFTRDDQIFHQLNSGINVGQHEGGGKSLEIRRFGFNMDHGGVNGGLKVLVDDVQQNQGTQGHGQGYLGSLKSLSPELIDDVTIINGPFSAQYGDFSGLGVVHIRQREALADQYTVRMQGGNFNSTRGFFGFSPNVAKTDSYFAYEGSNIDGPFQNPGRYRRDNVNANYTRHLSDHSRLGFRLLLARNNFFSSGQIPTDLIHAGQLDRFGYIDPHNGGHVNSGTLSTYYAHDASNGDTFRLDGFISRSLFDLYSNFTFFLNDPVNGDEIQQHDSRLQEGVNAQYSHAHVLFGRSANLVAGGNFHDNQIRVGLNNTVDRTPISIASAANAHVTNGAGYAQESVTLGGNRLLLSGGVRFDEFRYAVTDHVNSQFSGARSAGRWQGKFTAAYTPSLRVPFTLHANYGRGINSVDARGVVQYPNQPRLATTDFYQVGASSNTRRFGVSVDAFLIDHSNEQVYIPDDGSTEFAGPSRAYGFEAKTSASITRYISINGGITKVSNAFYRDSLQREYVTNAPHFVANAALSVAAWHGWSGSLRMRAGSGYRLDGFDPSIRATGFTVFDFATAKQIRHGVELNFTADNLADRSYWETQNYFESRVAPTAPIVGRIHATPGYPFTIAAGITLRFGEK